jgi:hypothetical protein
MVDKFEGEPERRRPALRVTVHLKNIYFKLWLRKTTTRIREDFENPYL